MLEAVFPGLKDTERAAAGAGRGSRRGKGGRALRARRRPDAGASLHFAECCSPVPGDRIVGMRGAGAGVAVHTIDCPSLAEFEDREGTSGATCTGRPRPSAAPRQGAGWPRPCRNAPGVLGQACTIIGEAGGNIVNLRMHHRQADFFDVGFDIDVMDAATSTHIAAALRACPSIERWTRTKG